MAKLALVRVDSRLAHGVVCMAWCPAVNANHVVAVDDATAQDPYMAAVYTMAAPTGVSIDVISVDEVVKRWKEDALGTGRVILIFKTVAQAMEGYRRGIPFDTLQLGTVTPGRDRVQITYSVFLDLAEVTLLREFQDKNVEVIFQFTPDQPPAGFDAVIKGKEKQLTGSG